MSFIQTELQLIGLKRSGNHAIASWLCRQSRGPVLFCHHVSHFLDPVEYGRRGELPNTINLGELNRQNPEAAKKLLHENHEILLATYEDLRLRRLNKERLFKPEGSILEPGNRRFRIFILRDFYNWAASRLKLEEKKNNEDFLEKFPAQINSWLTYARQVSSKNPIFTDNEPYRQIFISYNKWNVDEAYRAAVIGRLGLQLEDNSIGHVARFGGGSSFDGMKKAEDPGSMKVEERWTLLLEDRFRGVRQAIEAVRPQIDRFNQRLFGMTCPFD